METWVFTAVVGSKRRIGSGNSDPDPGERIIWEAPQKAQQLYFLELSDVMLTRKYRSQRSNHKAVMRIGCLRGDTFMLYLDK